MGESAAESENAAVSAFGKQMIADHGMMNDELAALAKRKGVEPPTGPDLASQAKGAVVGVMPGTAFDKQYVSSQLDDHKETLALYQKEAAVRPGPGAQGPGREGHPHHSEAHHATRGAAEAAGASVRRSDPGALV
jgi:predicted outer membrane protein